ncbi:MAG: imidazole glycerol phosphate synthase subunit HisH [Colwellia sp.]
MSVIAIIDYDVGNIKSIHNAFKNVGADIIITRNKDEILSADGVVLPGVGAFAHGMKNLCKYELDSTLREVAESGKPILGICLGMQMLFSSSTEFEETSGLGLIPGKVIKLPLLNEKYQKLPHVSWNELNEFHLGGWENSILDGISEKEDMYFVHSFFTKPDKPEDILSSTIYSDHKFCSTVRRGNIYGCQYHPEKSSVAGLKIINNFKNICMVNNDD